ncbi:PqqD family protein [Butyricicoccus intestinisimiae]|uniref:PqqD family protein n=1 Tax=Butyricicoccus intestinisimiae TaxID=2841509 RepID=A0ABS6EQQ4_9FIRM|nr:PqqD family protein [Butyricicoccus intestinisimiae]MBU5490038.1 PqqD family protein [Butyricicoccus intestinisimiae]
MKLKSTIILRKIAGETILIPVGEDAVRVNGLITVNEVGALICEQLKEERTVDALVAAVTAQFDVDAQTARTDIASFIHTLEENDLLA